MTIQRRFYDQEPAVKVVLELIPLLPPNIQEAVAKGIAMVAIRDHHADRIFKSLGAEVTLSMYKSKQKRRAYDQLSALHQGFNYLRVLESEQRKVICKKIIEITGYVAYYLETCQKVERNAETSHVEEIRNVSIQEGKEQAQLHIQRLCETITNHLPYFMPKDPIIRVECESVRVQQHP